MLAIIHGSRLVHSRWSQFPADMTRWVIAENFLRIADDAKVPADLRKLRDDIQAADVPEAERDFMVIPSDQASNATCGVLGLKFAVTRRKLELASALTQNDPKILSILGGQKACPGLAKIMHGFNGSTWAESDEERDARLKNEREAAERRQDKKVEADRAKAVKARRRELARRVAVAIFGKDDEAHVARGDEVLAVLQESMSS